MSGLDFVSIVCVEKETLPTKNADFFVVPNNIIADEVRFGRARGQSLFFPLKPTKEQSSPIFFHLSYYPLLHNCPKYPN